MKQRILYLTIPIVLFILACKIGPVPIQYGEDMCHYCWMTIVEKGYAAEVVTSTGKAYKFDAIECMINHIRNEQDEKIALHLVNGLLGDGSLIDATLATYLRSQAIPSPMGAYLSAFESAAEAAEVHAEFDGTLYNWEELLKAFDGIDAAMKRKSFDVEEN